MSSTTIINGSYAFSVISGFCDFTYGILPIFIVWNLNINRRTKCAVAILLGMGIMYISSNPLLDPTTHLRLYSASAATIIRIPYIKALSQTKDIFCMDFQIYPCQFSILAVLTPAGPLDVAIDVGWWSGIELGLSIAAASLATLRPLFFRRNYRLSYYPSLATRIPSTAILPSRSGDLAGDQPLESWPPAPAAVVTTIHGSRGRSTFRRSSVNSEEDFRRGDGGVGGKYSIQKTAIISTVERLDHHDRDRDRDQDP